MGMDLTGAVLTTAAIRESTDNIKATAKNIEETMNTVGQIMTTLTGQSEGGLIKQTTEAVEQLTELVVTLIDSIHKIANAITSFLEDMLEFDQKAMILLTASLEG